MGLAPHPTSPCEAQDLTYGTKTRNCTPLRVTRYQRPHAMTKRQRGEIVKEDRVLSEETVQEIRAAMKRYPRQRSAVLDTLRAVQRQFGYCKPEALPEAAEILGIDANALQMLVTFYDMLYDEPVGEHILMPCKNIACFLRGSDQIIEHICDRLKIKPGETTPDGKFTLQPMECLAACDLAPMMIADETYYGNLTNEKVDELLD